MSHLLDVHLWKWGRERKRALYPTDSRKIIREISVGGWATLSPYAGNSVFSHPCCRWDQRQLGESPLTDLNQLIRITNYTVSHTHLGGGGWTTESWCQLCFSRRWFIQSRLWISIAVGRGPYFFIYLSFYSFLVSRLLCLWEYLSWRHGERSLGSEANGFFIVIPWRAFYPLLRLISSAWSVLPTLSAFVPDGIRF